MKKTAFMMLVFLLLFSLTTHTSADTIIDTTYSIPEMDGGIGYNTYWETYGVDTGLFVGDWWDWFNGGNGFTRSFVSFPIPETPEGYELDSAYIYIYQHMSVGNSLEGLFPIWDMPWGSYEYPCYLDHVDYGLYLDEEDFDSGVLENHIGDISETYEVGWRTLEITQYVEEDIQDGREYSQYRLRFPIDTDYDGLMDLLILGPGEALVDKPFIRFVFENNNLIDEETQLFKNDIVSIYPNPVRDNFTIEFEISKQKRMQVSLYNVRGERVKSIYNGFTNNGENSFTIETDNLLSGVYFIKIDIGDVNITRKILIIK